jgi:hypothetical protein
MARSKRDHASLCNSTSLSLFDRAAMSPKSRVFSGKASVDLPDNYLIQIGRIVVRWAYFEALIQSLISFQIDLTPAEARLALREPRTTDRLEMLRALMFLHEGTWDDDLYRSIYSRTKTWDTRRDLFAHSIWGHDKKSDEWRIQVARGKWPKHLEKKLRGNKRVMPASVLITDRHLLTANTAIDKLIDDLERLKASASWKRKLQP